jgi:ATP-dependent helicase/DNAse subunit B
VDKKRADTVRRLGLVRAEEDILEALEHTEAGREHRWLPVVHKRDGSIDPKKSSIATGNQMERIIAFTEEKLMEFSRAVAGGDVTVEPAGEDACRYCAFRSACFVEGGKPPAAEKPITDTERVIDIIDGKDGEEENENGQI